MQMTNERTNKQKGHADTMRSPALLILPRLHDKLPLRSTTLSLSITENIPAGGTT